MRRNYRPRKNQKSQKRNPAQNLKQSDTYVICGRNAVLDSLRIGNIIKVFVADSVTDNDKVKDIISRARKEKAQVDFVSKKEIDVLSKGYDNNQGVAALCKKSRNIDLVDFLHRVEDKENVCLLMLTEIEYEQNLGAILRTLDASGVDGIIVSNRIKNTDSVVVKKISMGASESVPMFSQNIFIAARILKENGFQILGIESMGKKSYVNQDFSGKIALVFGGEDKSLTEPVIDLCDDVLSIPMKGFVTSLNVSVSVAVVVYERLRQVNINDN